MRARANGRQWPYRVANRLIVLTECVTEAKAAAREQSGRNQLDNIVLLPPINFASSFLVPINHSRLWSRVNHAHASQRAVINLLTIVRAAMNQTIAHHIGQQTGAHMLCVTGGALRGAAIENGRDTFISS